MDIAAQSYQTIVAEHHCIAQIVCQLSLPIAAVSAILPFDICMNVFNPMDIMLLDYTCCQLVIDFQASHFVCCLYVVLS